MEWTLASSRSLHVHGTFLTFHPKPWWGGRGGGGQGLMHTCRLKYWERLHGVDRCDIGVSRSDI